MKLKNKALFMTLTLLFFSLVTLPTALANTVEDDFGDIDCYYDDPEHIETSIDSIDWYLNEEPGEVYPIVEIEFTGGSNWIGRAGDSGNLRGNFEAELVERDHGFEIIITSEYQGDEDEDSVDYCALEDNSLELHLTEIVAEDFERDFNFVFQGYTWDDSTTELNFNESLVIDKDHQYVFHEGYRMPNLGPEDDDERGYNHGNPIGCYEDDDTDCVRPPVDTLEELLIYTNPQDVWEDFFWPPYEENSYQIADLTSLCEEVSHSVREYVANEIRDGSLELDEEADLVSTCPIEPDFQESIDDPKVHEVLRDLENYEIHELDKSWEGEDVRINIEVLGSGLVELEVEGSGETFEVEQTDTIEVQDSDTVVLTAEDLDDTFMSWDGDCEDADGRECVLDEVMYDKDVYAEYTDEPFSISLEKPESGDRLLYGAPITVSWESSNNMNEGYDLEEVKVEISGQDSTETATFDIEEEVSEDGSIENEVQVNESMYEEVDLFEPLGPVNWELTITDVWEGGEEIESSTSQITMITHREICEEEAAKITDVDSSYLEDHNELDDRHEAICPYMSEFKRDVFHGEIKNRYESQGWEVESTAPSRMERAGSFLGTVLRYVATGVLIGVAGNFLFDFIEELGIIDAIGDYIGNVDDAIPGVDVPETLSELVFHSAVDNLPDVISSIYDEGGDFMEDWDSTDEEYDVDDEYYYVRFGSDCMEITEDQREPFEDDYDIFDSEDECQNFENKWTFDDDFTDCKEVDPGEGHFESKIECLTTLGELENIE